MRKLSSEEQYAIYVISKMDGLTPAQLTRFLFETGMTEPFDLKQCLAILKEDGLLKQTVTTNGVAYSLTEQGVSELEQSLMLPAEITKNIDKTSVEFLKLFEIEKDYPAQYTEQANAIVPVFLSIREGQKILLKVSIIVPDVETAKVVKQNWMKNAHKTHKAVWECIGEGLPFPEFIPY